jgi:hypothetical protein
MLKLTEQQRMSCITVENLQKFWSFPLTVTTSGNIALLVLTSP